TVPARLLTDTACLTNLNVTASIANFESVGERHGQRRRTGPAGELRAAPADRLGQEVLRPGRRPGLGRPAGPREAVPAPGGGLALRHHPVGLDDARAAPGAVPPGAGQRAL